MRAIQRVQKRGKEAKMPIQIVFWPMRAIQLVQKKKAKLEGGVREETHGKIGFVFAGWDGKAESRIARHARRRRVGKFLGRFESVFATRNRPPEV